MILVDTSIWIDHINVSDPVLVALLTDQRVLVHPYVIAEIALGSLRNREVVLGALRDLPGAPVATPEDALFLVEREKLFNRGIGYADTGLCAIAGWNRDLDEKQTPGKGRRGSGPGRRVGALVVPLAASMAPVAVKAGCFLANPIRAEIPSSSDERPRRRLTRRSIRPSSIDPRALEDRPPR